VRLLTGAHPGEPAFDQAVTEALLRRVAAGELGPVARVFVPGATMAFGRLDRLRPGYDAALEAARSHGYAPVLRLGGGHAAGYDAGAVVVELITPQEAPIAEGVEARFAAATALLVEALGAVGVGAQVGELPGEYCPGRFSVHAGGVKLAGTAQRTIRGASLVAAAVLVQGGARLRAALVDVYAALDLAWAPATAGAAEDVVPGVTPGAVAAGLEAGLTRRHGPLEPAALDPATLALARTLPAG
jgi:octanoyl-[GcvH]:protein N-octanoyltransferase